MKNKLLSLLGALTLAAAPMQVQAQSIEPHGEIDISYLPSYYGYGLNEQLLKTKLKTGLEFDFNKDLSAYVFGSETTLSEIGNPFFNPKMQSYDIGLGVKLYDFEFYVNHDCTHPIASNPFYATDSEGNRYWINWTGFTKLGVKYKW